MIFAVSSGVMWMLSLRNFTALPKHKSSVLSPPLTRDIDIAILSVRPFIRDNLVLDENGLTYCHSFSPCGSPIILVLPASNIFIKF